MQIHCCHKTGNLGQQVVTLNCHLGTLKGQGFACKKLLFFVPIKSMIKWWLFAFYQTPIIRRKKKMEKHL